MKKFLDPQYEPLRRYVYTVLTGLVGVAVVVGWLTGEQAVTVTALVGAALAVPAVEAARAQVTPTVKVEQDAYDAQHAAQ